jgi:hypothetical protein
MRQYQPCGASWCGITLTPGREWPCPAPSSPGESREWQAQGRASRAEVGPGCSSQVPIPGHYDPARVGCSVVLGTVRDSHGRRRDQCSRTPAAGWRWRSAD